MISIYIHIPFCYNKCKYCSFFVVPSNNSFKKIISDLKEKYVKSLINEIKWWAEVLIDKQVKTIYI
jgi:oxygen-independent coproporphyrinogen-3 oxidase